MTEIDPEVTADIVARAQSERDKTRKGQPAWQPPAIVEEWPCRTCGSAVGVTPDAIEAAHVFDRVLSARGEPTIDRSRTMFCQPCVNKHKAHAAERRAHEQEQTAELVRKLKRSPSPEAEHELLLALRAVGHPDIPGLVQTIRDRLTSKGKRANVTKGDV